MKTMKLYRVNLRGMQSSVTGVSYGVSYVVADDAQKAYDIVREFLDEQDIGYRKDRCLESVELIAGTNTITETGTLLFHQSHSK